MLFRSNSEHLRTPIREGLKGSKALHSPPKSPTLGDLDLQSLPIRGDREANAELGKTSQTSLSALHIR